MAATSNQQHLSRWARLAEPLRDRGTRRLVTAFAISETGDGISAVVVPLAVFELSGSIALLAGSMAARVLLSSAAVAVGGYVADRHDRKTVIVASYLLRAALIAALVVLPASGPLFAAVGILSGALGSVDNPSTEAWLRSRMVHNLQGMATVRQVAQSCSWLIGPAVGGAILALSDTRTALVIDAATFVVALLLIARLATPAAVDAVAVPSEHGAGPVTGLRQIAGHTRRDALLQVTFTARFLTGAAVAAVVVAAVAYLHELPGAPTGAYGWSLAAYAIGTLVGLPIAGAATWRVSTSSLLRRSTIAYGVICLGGVVAEQWWLLALSWLVWGIAFGPESIVTDARLAASTAPGLLGRIYAARTAVELWAAATGYAVAGVAGSFVGPRTLIVGAGIFLLTVTPAAITAVAAGQRSTT